MKKSQTGVALPLISCRKQSSTIFSKGRVRSVFVEKVKQEFGQEDQYELMQSQKISDQQKKLKQLLRQFNNQSHHILAEYITTHPEKTTKSFSVRNSQTEIKIAEKQLANTERIMEQCEQELKTLQSRCDNLKYLTREDMEKHSILLRGEIDKLRTENKDMGRQVTLNGLNICRGEKSSDIKEMEYEKVQLQFKKTQLFNNNAEVILQNQNIKQYIAIIDKQGPLLQPQFKEALINQSLLHTYEHNKEVQKDKRKYFESMRSRNEQCVSGLKQRYFIKLRELEQLWKNIKERDGYIVELQQRLLVSRNQLIILQHKFSAVKHHGTTIKLLESKQLKK